MTEVAHCSNYVGRRQRALEGILRASHRQTLRRTAARDPRRSGMRQTQRTCDPPPPFKTRIPVGGIYSVVSGRRRLGGGGIDGPCATLLSGGDGVGGGGFEHEWDGGK